jgi:hypothetical protein
MKPLVLSILLLTFLQIGLTQPNANPFTSNQSAAEICGLLPDVPSYVQTTQGFVNDSLVLV